jgi:hypothetical protein
MASPSQLRDLIMFEGDSRATKKYFLYSKIRDLIRRDVHQCMGMLDDT